MIPLAQLLQPVRDGAPCGDDPWASGVLAELETTMRGKPETQFSAAEDPDWPRLRARALEVAGATKDLRVAALLASVLLRTDGLAGFAEGMKLIRGYLDAFWDTVFPRPDPAEGNDPAERLNALANLAVPPGTDGDLLKVVHCLRRVPLLSGAQTGRFALEHYLAVRDRTAWPEGAGPAPTAELLEAAKREVGASSVAHVVGTIHEVEAELDAIERVCRAHADGAPVSVFEPLRQELRQIAAWLGDGTGQGAAATPAATPPAARNGDSGETGWDGSVRNREEVVRALAAIIEYYRRCEPSSPVPFLLKRAARIVPMDFLGVMNELAPEAREKIVSVVGEEPAPPSG